MSLASTEPELGVVLQTSQCVPLESVNSRCAMVPMSWSGFAHTGAVVGAA
jgi:hypothetical protein